MKVTYMSLDRPFTILHNGVRPIIIKDVTKDTYRKVPSLKIELMAFDMGVVLVTDTDIAFVPMSNIAGLTLDESPLPMEGTAEPAKAKLTPLFSPATQKVVEDHIRESVEPSADTLPKKRRGRPPKNKPTPPTMGDG